ncbi:ROK family transcriptional regulator [Kocuria sp. cx-116]|uniref:ROK family transcriptional regulator n=1 Tax=Kocuria sp. cx-116 TaxID=2771378 RepID=UPI00168247D9|nr:ROK family transcriptional regulator [Kocuria sp. cx-116]MBD2762076.1 ROK family transcriptional regulator [Kocuria sp. cx-116]
MSLHSTTARNEAAPGSQTSLRVANQRRVIQVMRTLGTTTQATIARETALAPSTVSSIVHEMVTAGVLAMDSSHGGRRGQLVRFSDNAGFVVGLDVGHRHLTVAVADLNHNVRARQRFDLPHGHAMAEVLDTADSTLTSMVRKLKLSRAKLLAAGLTLPAPVDLEGRVVSAGAILPAWADTDVRAAASTRLGLPVTVENDANAGAVGEFAQGRGRGVRNMAYIKVSHGVGAGLILNGRLFRGATGSAGELGHMTLDEQGDVCRCGNRGCLETFISSEAVLGLMATTRGPDFTVSDLVDTALAGDIGCARVIGDTGRTLGTTVANLCNIINPELVIVGGELARAGDLLLGPLREVVSRYGVQGCTRELTISAAELGPEAHLTGALIMALENISLPL